MPTQAERRRSRRTRPNSDRLFDDFMDRAGQGLSTANEYRKEFKQGNIDAYSRLFDDITQNYDPKQGIGEMDPLALEMAMDMIAPVGMVAKTAKGVKSVIGKTRLEPDELALLESKGRPEQFSKARSMPGMNANDLAAMAARGWAKRGWYKNSAKALVDVFGPEDSKLFAKLLAATSPQTSVESNLKNSLNMWKNWTKAGRPTDEKSIIKLLGDSVEGEKGVDSALQAWRNNTVRALNGESLDLSGPKVSSFSKNLMGHMGEVTNDAWMAKAMDVDQDIFKGMKGIAKNNTKLFDDVGELGRAGPGYLAATDATREAAEILSKQLGDTVDPAEVQETVWSLAKALWERRDSPGELRSMRDLLGSGELTNDDILGVPDFSTLLRENPEYSRIVHEAGLGPNLNRMAPAAPPGPAPRPPSMAAERRALDRLEGRYRLDSMQGEQKRLIDRMGPPSEPGGIGTGPFAPGRETRLKSLQRVPSTPWNMDPYVAQRMKSLGVDVPMWRQLPYGAEESAGLFADTIARIKGKNRYGAAVQAYGPEDYLDSWLFMHDSGRAGFAVGGQRGDDIRSLFKDEELNLPNMAYSALPMGIQAGGRRLDAFDTVLPGIYSRAGFQKSGHIPWNEEFAPPGWNKELFAPFNKGEPDVVLMGLNPQGADVLPIPRPKYGDVTTYGKSKKTKRNQMLFPEWDDAATEAQDAVVAKGKSYLGW